MIRRRGGQRPSPCPKLLLVESEQEVQVLPFLLKENGVEWSRTGKQAPVWIEPQEGYSNILKEKVIATELQNSGLQALGILIDADQDVQSRWRELRLACLPSIPDLPEDIAQTGLVHVTAEGIRFGIWIMPDNRSSGMLETFLSYLIPESGENLWLYAQEVVTEAKKRGATFIDNHRDKANIYTWLAWQKPPGQKFRDAITEKIFAPTNPRSQTFVTWFKSLYEL
jgi:hypothetical protein